MAPKGRAALQKRQKARADLKDQDIIWIGFAATEFNIQRIGWLLLLADWPKVEIEKYEDQLAGVIPMDGEPEMPALEVDYALMRKNIVTEMARLMKAGHSVGAMKEVLAKRGGYTVADVPNDNLLGLLADLQEMK